MKHYLVFGRSGRHDLDLQEVEELQVEMMGPLGEQIEIHSFDITKIIDNSSVIFAEPSAIDSTPLGALGVIRDLLEKNCRVILIGTENNELLLMTPAEYSQSSLLKFITDLYACLDQIKKGEAA